MNSKRIFIASTGKDVGKTTLSLGLIDYLNHTHGPCGFMKPVGQEQLNYQGVMLDKDAILVKNFFNLKETTSLSPISVPQGFTKDYLDGKISHDALTQKILKAYEKLEHYPSLVIEGTGHLGVGSIFDLNNAQVAKLLNCPVLLVTKGGLGSSFDELMLNIALCHKYQIEVKGVILNKVIPEKKQMISSYFQKALSRQNIPFLGALPFDMLLAKPTFQDIEQVLELQALFNENMSLKHIENMMIIGSNNQLPDVKAYDLVILSSSREGLIHGLIQHSQNLKIPLGFILTGTTKPSEWILQELEKTPHFVAVTDKNSQDVLLELSNFHAKIQSQDSEKIKEAIALVKQHVDLKKLFS